MWPPASPFCVHPSSFRDFDYFTFFFFASFRLINSLDCVRPIVVGVKAHFRVPSIFQLFNTGMRERTMCSVVCGCYCCFVCGGKIYYVFSFIKIRECSVGTWIKERTCIFTLLECLFVCVRLSVYMWCLW